MFAQCTKFSTILWIKDICLNDSSNCKTLKYKAFDATHEKAFGTLIIAKNADFKNDPMYSRLKAISKSLF